MEEYWFVGKDDYFSFGFIKLRIWWIGCWKLGIRVFDYVDLGVSCLVVIMRVVEVFEGEFVEGK